MRTAVLILALASLVAAENARIPREAFRMAPGLTNPQRYTVANQYFNYLKQSDTTAQRLKQVEEALEKKPKNAAPLIKERDELRKRIPALVAQADQALTKGGIAPETIARMRRMPKDPLAEERYNHSVLLEADGLTADQERMLRTIVAAADAAQGALYSQRKRNEKALKNAEKLVRQQVLSGLDRQRSDIEKRFWHAAHCVLTPDQMRQARELFSPRYRYPPQLEEKIQMLPGMTPARANRVRALFAELESESTADTALVQRTRVQMRDTKLDRKVREGYAKEQQAANARLGKLREEFRLRLIETLTEEQLDALKSMPPILSANDLRQPPQRVFKGIGTRRDQLARLAPFQKEMQVAQRKIQNDSRSAMAGMAMGEFGPESPQQMTMMMTRRGSEGALFQARREMLHRILLQIYEPQQVAQWIVGPLQ